MKGAIEPLSTARRSFVQVDTSLWSLSYQRQENAQLAIYLSALDPASENLLIIHLDDELLPLIDSARLVFVFAAGTLKG